MTWGVHSPTFRKAKGDQHNGECMAKINGAVFYRGVSRIDGKTSVVGIITGLAGKGSENSKTGAMVQTWILRDDVTPMDAVIRWDDVGICGGCIHRRQANGKRSCYVNVARGPHAIYGAFQRGRYPIMTPDEVAVLLTGRKVRLGAYGDPTAIPLDVWTSLVRHTAGHTGYTHNWRNGENAGYAELCQASCETWTDVERATAKGFGSFYVVPKGTTLPTGAIHCPASAEAGKRLQCEDCLLCDGAHQMIVVIHAHGQQAKNYNPRVLPVL